MSKVVTFGEIMLRLSPEGYCRLMQNDRLIATFGGAEANVACSLANYGEDVAFATKLPDNEIGEAAVRRLRGFGVNVSKIVRGGERTGIYFMEKGASQRGSKCIYDRAHSAIQECSPEDFHWDEIFDEDTKWFHFTGITPALGPNVTEACLAACRYAGEHGITVSCDLNYRKNLWSREEARKVMKELAKYVDVCVGNEEDAKDVFGIEAEGSDIQAGKLEKEGYQSVARQLMERFHFKMAAITLRESFSANDNDWSAMLYDGQDFLFSRKYHLHIVDRVGGGDSFSGGLIYELVNGRPKQEALEFAVAASALKHSIEGDINRVSKEEVEKLMKGTGSGRVER